MVDCIDLNLPPPYKPWVLGSALLDDALHSFCCAGVCCREGHGAV